MGIHRFGVGLGIGLLAGSLSMPDAAAHHGWAWAEGDQTELRGTIREVYIGQPHPALRVESEGRIWIVELGNPRQTARSGFTETSARPGDQVIAIGNRSRDPGELRMKAVRLRLGGRSYDIYPERIR